MMKLLGCLDLDYFELFLCTVFRSKCYSETEINFWRNWQRAYSQFTVTRYDDVVNVLRFELFSCTVFRGDKRVKYIFNSINSEPIVILGYNLMITSSKCLHLDYFGLFLYTLFRSKYYHKRLKKIFDVIGNGSIVTLGYKVMMSSNFLDLELFCKEIEVDSWRNCQWAYSHSRIYNNGDVVKMFRFQLIWVIFNHHVKGPYIKYVGVGAGGFLWGPWNILGIYWWAMKYFSNFLMGHEIFLYVLFS